MANLPTDVANQALDAAAVEFTLGDLEEGTRSAQVTLRAYGECLRQLLRGAPWDFARRESPLVLVADATGQTPNVGTMVPSGFVYAYLYPTDCARVRYIPWCPFQSPGAPAANIQPSSSSAPIVTNLGQSPNLGQRIVPARYLITNDVNYPPPPGQINWETQGVSPQGRLLILTNVKEARCVYTTTVLYPSMWDHLFRAAFVSYLGSEVALTLAKDKKLGLQVQDRLIVRTKEKIQAARIADGNEMWASSDIPVDWMRSRNSGGAGNFGFGGWGGAGGVGDYGCFGGGWAGSCGFADGSAY